MPNKEWERKEIKTTTTQKTTTKTNNMKSAPETRLQRDMLVS